MKLLLDTHTLLWWLSDDSRLGSRTRMLIADPGNDILVSVATFWEIVVKVRVGKLEADIEAILTACAADGFATLDVRPSHLRMLVTLPMHHKDPFDHLLIAQAITEEATFLSLDRYMASYAVPVIAASEQAEDLT